LRDIVVTEYGIASLRGKSDQEVFKQLIRIADSRFQPELVSQAKAAGKIPQDWEVPPAFRNNTPGRIRELIGGLQAQGDLFPRFPFGCDFTDEELELGAALKSLKVGSETLKGRLRLFFGALTAPAPTAHQQALLRRMGLESPAEFREKLERRLVIAALTSNQH